MKCPMLVDKDQIATCHDNHYIYAIGGYGGDNSAGAACDCERYNVGKDK